MENKMTFHGSGREYFGIWIVNILLSVLTLGIYSAWAKVRTKRYFYGNTELAGDRFEYHATPIQILIGRIVATIAVIIWFAVGQFFPIASMFLLVFGLLVMPWLLRNNARFNAKMTSFRNVRLNFTGTLLGAYGNILGRGAVFCFIIFVVAMIASAQISVGVTIGTILVGIAVLFVTYAWIIKGISSYFANGYGYGKLKFKAELSTGFFVRTYLWAILIGTITMIAVSLVSALVTGIFVVFSDPSSWAGMDGFPDNFDPDNLTLDNLFAFAGVFVMLMVGYGLFFAAMLVVTAFIACRTRNHVFNQMQIEGMTDYRLGSNMDTTSYALLIITNFFLQVFTLGLARPWVKVRTARYVLSVTTVHGDLNELTAFDDQLDANSSIGDEVSQAFDLEIGIG
ncbi:hypothetical protein BCT30_22155 [Enterovibrio norvegicus]|uniref:YjgN family protein n=1 Tax=Enterovibrio norvegicus TaxID=188144 RepID=UPI000C85B812|nr:YjgN family protein [Enterovibrio norvegicus]MCC4800538.1 DUF898 domain-containing protein [Enterovibrio norvegicus]PMH59445.1 hypothetical protein BCU62_22420 [Enterovibrio norvegicus]PMI32200.1 hypothetical protein BCU46_23485 [Enterovibrio norvegicus]PMN46338.1 hypothetical protein BCT30_22155 [Enterovibrio norvegicus]TKF14032.1 DUF898 domain-containing protein [Enterovibrio norvegicus]